MYTLFLKGGPIMWPLLALSILALAIGIHRYAMLRAIIKKAKDPFAYQQAFQQVQHGIDTLHLIASIAPLLGLLGTVFGIIVLFSSLSGGRPDADILSQGLSQALFTTAAGLIIAVPTQVAAHLLQQQLDRVQGKKRPQVSTESANPVSTVLHHMFTAENALEYRPEQEKDDSTQENSNSEKVEEKD